jgi:hypothetical protein
VEVLERIVEFLRQAWPEVKIIVRADSGFAREALMSWCESHQVDYVLGLARNSRLERALKVELARARRQWQQTGQGRAVSKTSVIRRGRAGAGGGGWWARPNI